MAIKRQAFGRNGSIGSLYDARTDKFEGGKLFDRSLPSSMVETTDSAKSEYIVDENKSLKETFNKLNVDASLKLSLMAGLIKVDGSAKYLTQTKTDNKTVRVTFMLNLRTKQDNLQISRHDLCDYFSKNALDNQDATHFVSGITWGARVAATFETTLSSSEAAQELQGRLALSLSKISMKASGNVDLDYVNKDNCKFESMKINFSGDILLKDTPSSIEDVYKIFKEVPTLLKDVNNGKGQQLEFELYPLQRIAENFQLEIRIQR